MRVVMVSLGLGVGMARGGRAGMEYGESGRKNENVGSYAVSEYLRKGVRGSGRSLTAPSGDVVEMSWAWLSGGLDPELMLLGGEEMT